MRESQSIVPCLAHGLGWSDSTALLELVCAYAAGEGLRMTGFSRCSRLSFPRLTASRPSCLHVNHMLRGADSDADERFVRGLCEGLDVPCEVQRVDVGVLARSRRGGMEAVAREERYRLASLALERACVQAGTEDGLICTAHTIDDRVETFFMRALVGTGPGACIHPARSWQAAQALARRVTRATARLAEKTASGHAR